MAVQVTDPYLSALAASRKRSQDLRDALGSGTDAIAKGFGGMAALQEHTADRAVQDEEEKRKLAQEDRLEETLRLKQAGGTMAMRGLGSPAMKGLRSKLHDPELGDAASGGEPMTMDDALGAHLTEPMSTLPRGAAAQVADVGDIMQKAGVHGAEEVGEKSPDDELTEDYTGPNNADGAPVGADVRALFSSPKLATDPTDKEREQKAKADAAEANVPAVESRAAILRKKASGPIGNPGAGAPSLKDQKRKLDIEREQQQIDAAKKKAAGGPVNPSAMDQRIKEADELASIYESGKLNETGGELLDPEKHPTMSAMMSSPERIRARQLATGLSLGVPSAFSGSTRLNNTEFVHSLKSIVGTPDTSMSNADKAKMARNLANDLRAMKGEIGGASSGGSVTRTNTATPEAVAGPSTDMIRVRLKDGRTGKVPASSFDPASMERL